MRKKILVSIMVVIIMVVSSVETKADVAASVTGTDTIQVGKSGSIKISVPDDYLFNLSVVITGDVDAITLSGSDMKNNKVITLSSNSSTLNVKANKVGKATVTFTGFASKGSGQEPINTITKVITVVEASTGGGNKPVPKPPVLDKTEEEKVGKTQTPEEKLAIEAERKRVELEALKLVPLVKKMSFTSNSTKMNGQLIDTINFVNSQFDYEVTLPQNINSILIDVPSVEGVELSYDKEITLGSDVESQVIEVKAKQGEIDQVIKVKINKNTTPLIEREFSKEKLDVYHDNQMNAFFKGFGYEAVVDETVGTYYDNTFTKFQMLVEDDNNAIFFTLNDSLELETKISLMVSESDELFLINSEANPESTINGNPKTKIVFENLLQFTKIDSSLIVDANVYGWDLEEGLVVEGLTSQGIESKFLITEANDLVKVLVPNDVEAPADYVKLASGIGFIALLSTNIIYFVTREIRKRRNEVIY